MRLLRRRRPSVGVVIPVYGVEQWLPQTLASLVAQSHTEWEAIVIDDGALDRSGAVAQEWAARDRRIRVVHTENAGLGAARNAGVSQIGGDYLAFLDGDDVLPTDAYATMVSSLEASDSDFAAGSMQRWQDDRLIEPRWMSRTHRPGLTGATIGQRPRLLGDVFAWNKLYRRSWWDSVGLTWPVGVRYEDQPTTTRAFLSGTFDVLPEVVYHWRIRTDGTSITQQRARVPDLTDRWATKRWSLASVLRHDDAGVTETFVQSVLAGDMWRYFLEIPGACDDWWRLLVEGVREFWGDDALTGSTLPPVHRLCGWLVGQDRREDAERVVAWIRTLNGPAPRVTVGESVRLDVPPEVLDVVTVAPKALTVRPHEV